MLLYILIFCCHIKNNYDAKIRKRKELWKDIKNITISMCKYIHIYNTLILQLLCKQNIIIIRILKTLDISKKYPRIQVLKQNLYVSVLKGSICVLFQQHNMLLNSQNKVQRGAQVPGEIVLVFYSLFGLFAELLESTVVFLRKEIITESFSQDAVCFKWIKHLALFYHKRKDLEIRNLICLLFCQQQAQN